MFFHGLVSFLDDFNRATRNIFFFCVALVYICIESSGLEFAKTVF